MAPTYNRAQNRRQNRTGYVDHDMYEGLPIRHWRRDYVAVVPPATQESTTSQNDIWAVELPHGMPKDSHLLPQHSQDLLRAARSGRIYKRTAPAEEEEVDPEAVAGEKPEKKDDESKDKGFTAKAWKQIPRHMEGPDVEYLAARRKNLRTVAAKPTNVGPTITKATVKRIDAAGNEYVQNVVLQPGQQIDGEVISQTVVPAVTAPSLGEGLLTPTPPKRIPKRKMKGPGRGKKKQKLTPGPTSAPQVVDVDGITQSSVSDGRADSETQQENGADSNPTNGEDTEMADGSAHDSSDDEGDDGEEGDDDQETSADPKSPSKLPQDVSALSDIPPVADIPATTESEIKQVEDVAIPPLLQIEESDVKAGSPLKNVALTTSTPSSPLDAPTTAPPLSANIQPIEPVPDVAAPEIEVLNEPMQSEMATTTPPIIPSPPPAPGVAETVAAAELLKEEKEEEEMLLDIVEKSSNAIEGNDNDEAPPATEPEDVSNPEVVEAPSEEAVAPKHDSPKVAAVETIPETAAPTADDEDDEDDEDDSFPDLLGGLEKQLNDPVAETIQESEEAAPET